MRHHCITGGDITQGDITGGDINRGVRQNQNMCGTHGLKQAREKKRTGLKLNSPGSTRGWNFESYAPTFSLLLSSFQTERRSSLERMAMPMPTTLGSSNISPITASTRSWKQKNRRQKTEDMRKRKTEENINKTRQNVNRWNPKMTQPSNWDSNRTKQQKRDPRLQIVISCCCCCRCCCCCCRWWCCYLES